MTIKQHYNAASRLAVKEFVRLARVVMQKDPDMVECVAAMGIINFRDADDDAVFPDDRQGAGWDQLNKFLEEWDSIFKLSGLGVRFKLTGKVLYKW